MSLTNSDEINREIFLGWAKIKREKNDKEKKGKILNEFHSVIYHLLDAGACAYEILNREPRMIESICGSFLKIYSQNTCQKILSFFVAIHDLGKLSPVFQSLIGIKNKDHISLQQWKGKTQFWQQIERGFHIEKRICHGYISSYTLLDYFFSINPLLNYKSYPIRFAIAAGHHHDKLNGIPTEKFEKWNNFSFYEFTQRSFGDDEWQSLRMSVMENVWNIIVGEELKLESFILENISDSDEIKYQNDLQFAGFACAADWIASNEDYFNYCSTPCDYNGLIEYFHCKRRQASAVLSGNIFWGNQNSKYFTFSDFKDIFHFSPRSFQEDVLKFVEKAKNPSLVILEAPMGMGKTEAALSFLMSPFSKQSRGLYFALPTQATSNQMYGRINSILNYFFGEKNITVQNQLMHANKKWNDVYLDTLLSLNNDEIQKSNLNNSCEEVYESDYDDDYFKEDLSGIVTSSWHASSRTGLLAEFAVGTIDQVLRSILKKEKHYFVKHFALAGKTIILDEIHAYDAYMDKLICNLLEWLSLHNCQVILLSATLPKSKREKFLNAYSGLKTSTLNFGFPRITMVSKNCVDSFQEKVSSPNDLKSKKTPVKLIKINNFLDIVEQVLNNLSKSSDGSYFGVVGIVCNTVKTAQEVYLAFEEKGIKNENILLFHARFSMALRLEKEEFIKTRLGKDEFKKFIKGEESLRPLFKIIISTQVIEQSLDIDFDYMYSFLCPIDLLLQRMGRHYRRCRWDLEMGNDFKPSSFGVFYENCAEDHLPQFKLCQGSKKVYFEYILLKTFIVIKEFLKDNNLIDDIFDLENLIYKVYSEESNSIECERLTKEKRKLETDSLDKISGAAKVLLNLPRNYNKKTNWFPDLTKERQFDFDIKSQTRLFDSSNQLIFLVKSENNICYIDEKNNLFKIKNILDSDRNNLKRIIQTQITIPGYVYNNIAKGDLLEFFNVVKNSDNLRYYEGIFLNWNGVYAFKKTEKKELRYCAHLGFRFVNL
ncbi:CRISPR-associated helicase Cas3' [Fluviispira multicolorata]|uniref:CRISPR-associated helicase Cas3 n=1 Tax=Fluviispira multicolorata TaxID=2654512 RepID=A0A833N684_9BACT|nr:CRISPR-associated helicase Cas3' [Fluviispira multicolorata]KAB8032259.1 CRISPR-associated helicase Cas3' [Fluviispira multicolorata]